MDLKKFIKLLLLKVEFLEKMAKVDVPKDFSNNIKEVIDFSRMISPFTFFTTTLWNYALSMKVKF